MFHPACLLLAWGSLLILLQYFSLDMLLPVSGMIILFAAMAAKNLFAAMVRRSRWLLITMIVLFITMTPGVLVASPWNLGIITQEGLLGAAEQAIRLLALLALVALLLKRLDQASLVAAIFALLRPLAAVGINSERISVRLLLVLDYVAADQKDWRMLLNMPAANQSGGMLALSSFALRAKDVMLVGAAFAAVILVLVRK